MKKPIKLVLGLFVILLILPLAISCGEESANIKNPTEAATAGTDTRKTDAAEDEQPQRPALDLPDVKFDGYDFRVLNWSQSEMTWVFTTIVAEEETGAEVNDAVFRRNSTVEERFDINIREITAGWDLHQIATRSIQAGSDDYDLVMVQAFDAVGMAQRNMFVDYNEILYADLTQPWWDRDIVRDLSFMGRNYLVTGDFSMMHYGDTIGLFFNKQLLRDMELESPYDIINSGRWTFNKFFEMARGASSDLNGDGIMNEHDQYGYMSLTHIWLPGFLASAGQRMVGKDENDMHKFMMNDQQFINVYQQLVEIMHYGDMTFDADTAGDHRLQDIMFPNNQALFWSEVVHWATILRDMDADFGIVIHPKLDENQTDYHNHVYPPPVMGVPITAPDINRTGMILEALCYYSTDTVIKSYYDVLLKTKIARDDESEAMLDIMFNNRLYSLASIFYNSVIGDPLNTASKRSDANIVSWIERQESRILTAIERNNEAFLE
jgi:hypothetical protein